MDEDFVRDYTSICSAATLQSDKKGFFHSFVDSVEDLAGQTWLDQFSQLTSDNDRLIKCYQDSEVCKAVHGVLKNVTPVFRGKTAGLSRQRRIEGEKAASKGKLEQALLLLTQSVIRAPAPGVDRSVDDGLSLPMTLWSRARLLYELSEYQLCLTDLQIYLKEKVPEKIRVEAYSMMAQCYQKLGETTRARVSLQVALKLLGPEDSNLRKRIEDVLINLASSNQEIPQPKNCEEVRLGSEHSELPGLSSALLVQSEETSGRFVVARQRISSGDILAVEPPFTACLLPSKFGSHCHHCFTRLRWAVACKQCAGLAFCSVTCRDNAHSYHRLRSAVACKQCAGLAFCSVTCRDNANSYHQYECKFIDLMIGSGMSVLCHVALRTVTQQNYKYWQKVYINQPVTPDYTRIASLVTHADKRQPKDFLGRTLMALFLLQILINSHYIPSSDIEDGNLSGMRLFLGSVLLHLLQCLQFNAHEINETIYKSEFDFYHSKINYIGVGVYPSAALFNHDCYPAVTRYFQGKEIVIHAVRPLNPGEIVADNYGPVFSMRTRDERQKSLAGRYWFHCTCTACCENWPKLADLDDDTPVRIRCQTEGCGGFILTKKEVTTKKCKCPRCSKFVKIAETVLLIQSYDDDYSQGMELMNKRQLQDAAKIFATYSDVMHLVCHPPYKNVSLAHEALRSCLAYNHNKHIIK